MTNQRQEKENMRWKMEQLVLSFCRVSRGLAFPLEGLGSVLAALGNKRALSVKYLERITKLNDEKVQLALDLQCIASRYWEAGLRLEELRGILWICQQSICIIGRIGAVFIGAVFIEDVSLAFAGIGINDITPVTDARLRGIGWAGYGGVGVGSITEYLVIRGGRHSGA